MAPTAPRKQLALDTNILFDLAANLDAAHSFRETFQRSGYVLHIAPTVVQELGDCHLHGGTAEERRLALKALKNILSWGIHPFDLLPVGRGITGEFAEKLIAKGLLPEGEFHDGVILAETSLMGIPVLVTRDAHLLDIDPTSLRIAFDDADLFHVVPCHPTPLLRAMR